MHSKVYYVYIHNICIIPIGIIQHLVERIYTLLYIPYIVDAIKVNIINYNLNIIIRIYIPSVTFFNIEYTSYMIQYSEFGVYITKYYTPDNVSTMHITLCTLYNVRCT